MAIRQKDIADYLGISRQIVGYALSGNVLVAEETRTRVLKAADELGYSAFSNQAARSLIAQRYGSKSKSRKGVFAVLMPNPEGERIRKQPYFIPYLDGIEEQADAMELGVFLHSFRRGYVPPFIGDFLVDGVIGLSTTAERNEWMNLHGFPQVLIDHRFEGISHLRADHATGIAMCTQHLIDIGHRRIAYFSQLTADGYPVSDDRFESFNATMSRNGLKVDLERQWFQCARMQRESSREAMAEALVSRPDFTGIVCHNDLLAMGVIDALRQAGRRVPEDVSVTGFDDITCAFEFSPEITSVAFDREEMGRQAVRMLYANIDAVIADPLIIPKSGELIAPVKLVMRHSTAPIRRS